MKPEELLTVEKDGVLLAIVRHDMNSRHQVFYKVIEMGSDDLMDLYEENQPKTTTP